MRILPCYQVMFVLVRPSRISLKTKSSLLFPAAHMDYLSFIPSSFSNSILLIPSFCSSCLGPRGQSFQVRTFCSNHLAKPVWYCLAINIVPRGLPFGLASNVCVPSCRSRSKSCGCHYCYSCLCRYHQRRDETCRRNEIARWDPASNRHVAIVSVPAQFGTRDERIEVW